MEQRIGRIDRVCSQTERRLTSIKGALPGHEMLQVYFPHLEDTVEVLQVQRVLERMNVFLRLMHEGLTVSAGEESSIDAGREFLRVRQLVPQIAQRLESAFPVKREDLKGDCIQLAVSPELERKLHERFKRLASFELPGIVIQWESQTEPDALLGTAHLGNRVQPFALLLGSFDSYPVVRCISPVGRVELAEYQAAVVPSTTTRRIRLGAVQSGEDRTYDLTVEDDVVLAAPEFDALRVGLLIRRVVHEADLLEQEHLPGCDGVLDEFRKDLMEEGNHGR